MGLLLIGAIAFGVSWLASYLPRRDVPFYSVDGVFHETVAKTIRQGRGARALQDVYFLDGHSKSENENPLLLAVLLSRLPQHLRLWLQRHGGGVLLGMVAFAPAAAAAAAGRVGPAFAAVAVVIGTPMLLRESVGFNARLPGVVAVSGFWAIFVNLSGSQSVVIVVFIMAIVAASTALLHRLSLQALAFTAVAVTIAEADALPLVAAMVGWLAAFAIAPSHYRTVFAAHRRLLRLHRRTRSLNAKALAAYVGQAEAAARPPYWRAARLIGAGGATLFLFPWLVADVGQSPTVAVAIGLSGVAVATALIGPLRFLGEGERYFEFAAVAAAAAVAGQPVHPGAIGLIVAGIAVSVWQYRKLWRTARHDLTPALRPALHAALLRLRDEPETRILSLPMWTARFTAYVADKQVYEAAAHRTWVMYPQYAPVLTVPVRVAVDDLAIEGAFVDTRILLPQMAEIEASAQLQWESGPYRYYRF